MAKKPKKTAAPKPVALSFCAQSVAFKDGKLVIRAFSETEGDETEYEITLQTVGAEVATELREAAERDEEAYEENR